MYNRKLESTRRNITGREKRTELKYENKTQTFVTNESTVVQKGEIIKTNLVGIIYSSIKHICSHRTITIRSSKRMIKPFEQHRTSLLMTNVEEIKRTKIRQTELVQLYKEDKEWDAQPNDDDTVNKEDDDKDYESKNCGEPWTNYRDEKFITNTTLELVLRIFFEENIVWDFSYLKTWFN